MTKSFLLFCAVAFIASSCGKPNAPASSGNQPGGPAGPGTANSPAAVQKFTYTTSFSKTGISAGMTFIKPPRVRVNSPFVLRFWETGTGNPQTGPFIDPGYTLVSAELDKPKEQDSVFLFMDSMGHPSDVQALVTRIVDASGVSFYVDRVNFTMLGPWEVKVQFHKTELVSGKKSVVYVTNPKTNKEEAALVDFAQFNHAQKP